MLSELGDPSRIVGIRQVKRAIEAGKLSKVFLANDAEPRLTDPLKSLCAENAVTVIPVDSMETLGQACGISVGASVAGILK